MALRMVEMFVPDDSIDQVRATLEESDADLHGLWSEAMDGGCDLVRVLVSAGNTESPKAASQVEELKEIDEDGE